ncbi:COPII coat assembly protein SEC16 [Fundulus heteroclitus]|uniref:COPII coat assembly protein SEC16 n=1 Tax=Fundulus heteroclitus TaxID=8078 RepID=UPI00165CB3C4|nr:COPII coat assembly protein SEC16 [Fundulus heteroclitus]
MFSDSRATTTPGEQKGFRPHAPHFIPWLRNSLKAHHSSGGGGDLGLNGAYKAGSEGRSSLTPLERARGMGFFSIQGKDRAKKGELRCNGMGMFFSIQGKDRAKKGELRCNGMGMLPVVLRGHHILPGGVGKQQEDGPARWNKDPHTQASPEEGLADSSSSAPESRNVGHTDLRQTQNDTSSPPVRKYGPLVGPRPTPAPVLLAEKPGYDDVPVVVCVEGGEGKTWDYTSRTTYRQRDLHSSSWVSSDTRELIERQHGFSARFSYVNKHSRSSQSQRDLTEPPDGRPNGLVFPADTPPAGPGCTAAPRGARKPRPSSERISILGQNQTWVQHRPSRGEEPQRKGAGCSRKVVRNQIKRVVDNLEQVLTSLRDIQQEIKEVVQQIDYLTSSIDLDDEEQQRAGGEARPPSDSSYSSGSSSSDVTVRGAQRGPPGAEHQPGTVEPYGYPRREDHSRNPPSQNGQLRSVTSGFLSERSRTVRLTCGPVSTPSKTMSRAHTNSLPASHQAPLKTPTTQDHVPSPKRSLPARPPTPGLSPLTVNLQHPGSPGSQPSSPLSPKPHPPPALSPSVIIETKVGSHHAPQSDLPSAGRLSAALTHPLSASCPPTDSETKSLPPHGKERRASSAGPSHARSSSAGTAKPPTGQGRRGRKPPPYPHHRLSEPTRKTKEPRKAPPYPEKRRLLSTTV